MAKIFSTDDPGIVRLHFSDTTTAFDGIKRAVLKGKGISCCTVCSALFQALEKGGVPTYFVKEEGPRDLLCRSTEEIPLYLDANDIVRILGISKTNVYYMFRANGFPTISIGKRKFVRKEKLLSWLETQENNTDEQCPTKGIQELFQKKNSRT